MALSNNSQLVRKLLGPFRLHAVLQALIKNDRVPQIQDGVLIGGTFNRLEFVRLITLFVDFFQEGRQLSGTKIFSIALLPAEQDRALPRSE